MAEAEILDALYEHVLDGSVDGSVEEVQKGLAEGLAATALLYDAMIPALEEVGALFESGVIFLPEMLISANAMKEAMNLLRPQLAEAAAETIGTFLIGSVAGDIHDIGKNLCGVMLESTGFHVIDLGVNVPSSVFVEEIERHRPDIVGMSAFLTTTVTELSNNLTTLEKAGLRESVKVMVGGAPVTAQLAADIGADGYAPDASATARAAKAMVANSG